MLRHRTRKQIVIAFLFFGFWGSVISLVVWAVYEPPPPPPPPPPSADPLQAVSAQAIPIPGQEGGADLVGLIKNTNANAGAEEISYKFVVTKDGEVIKEVPGTTFILPARQKYVVAFNKEIPPRNVKVALKVDQPEWKFVEESFNTPSLVVVNKRTNVIPGNPDTFEVKGLLSNESNLNYLRVEIIVVGMDSTGEVLGVSHTFTGSLMALEQREFTAQWPLPAGKEVEEVRFFPTVNVFLPDAVQNPSDLSDQVPPSL